MSAEPLAVLHNGDVIPAERACVHVLNPAVTQALGVYETLQLANGHLFHLEDHLERLRRSAQALDLPLAVPTDQLAAWAHTLVAHAGVTEATLRVLALAGDTSRLSEVYMVLLPPIRHPDHLYTRGASAITFPGERALPTAKTLNTLVNALAQRRARALGCHEALLVARDGIREGASSNVFVVQQGRIITPPEHLIIAGVTRDIVLRLARSRGYAIVLRPIPPESLPTWEEAFITSTSRHVMPLTHVDGRPVGDGRVGPVTRELMAAFEAYFASQVGQPLPV